MSVLLCYDFDKGSTILFQALSRLASLCGIKLLSACLQKWNYRVDKKAVCHRHRQDATLSSDIKRKQQIQPDARLSYNEDIDDA